MTEGLCQLPGYSPVEKEFPSKKGWITVLVLSTAVYILRPTTAYKMKSYQVVSSNES